MKKTHLYTLIFILSLLLTSCGSNTPTEEAPSADAPEVVEEKAPTAIPEPTEEPPAESEPSATPIPFEPQPTEGQRIEFDTSDGTALVGYYYPASVPNAPVVVLMHWAGGDQTDWLNNGMIDWLQNRGGSGGIKQSPTSQSSIFPPMPEGVSFAVFTFDFRGFGESSGSFSSSTGLLDAQAAYKTAAMLEGVDPTHMAGIGSSIGADGVVDACAEGCLGALSLSPGSYLKVPYVEAVKTVDDEGTPVTCVASNGDATSANTCKDAAGENYQSILYAGNAHGDEYFGQPPDGFGQMIYDWLVSAFEL